MDADKATTSAHEAEQSRVLGIGFARPEARSTYESPAVSTLTVA